MAAEHDEHDDPDYPDPQSSSDHQELVAMQDSLLPTGVVALPAVDVAARYVIGDQGEAAGGDWFDTVPLKGGAVALVVGDVVGGGPGAIALMGQLRAVLSAGLLAERDPVAALRFLEAYAEVLPEAHGTTLVVTVLDPRSPRLRYCTAGHPPPVLVRADGRTSLLPPTGGGPLGSGAPYRAAEHPLEPGDVVLLHSDGLLTRRGVPPEQRLAQLRSALSSLRSAGEPGAGGGASLAERACEVAVRVATDSVAIVDDVAVAAAQIGVPTADLVLDLPALPDTVRVVRLELGAWLGALRLAAIDQLALQQAVGELVSNVVEHAYPSPAAARGSSLRVRATLTDDGIVVVDVDDDGTWQTASPRAPGGRRGLAMAGGFVDHLERVARPTGTRMRVRHRALRPATLLTHRRAEPPSTREADRLVVGPHGASVLKVSGAVDILGVDRLATELRTSATGLSEALSVELSEVTLLCSGAVQVLLDAVSAGRRPGFRPVVLHAAPGTVAQQVLELVQVPYERDRTSA